MNGQGTTFNEKMKTNRDITWNEKGELKYKG
jgi:hypothetical protein